VSIRAESPAPSMADLAAIRASAFVEHGPASIRLRMSGPLSELSFAVKDLYDVAGYRTACGNPDRLREEAPAVATAPAVVSILEAGATLVGKTHTDELACGMFGTNPHFGTPINPAVPDRVPGGSSSGSASAVAARLCDFALGSDTGGSVRVPASFCGLFGIRTSHGRISTAAVMAMAPSFDTVGWLARDAATLRRVGEVYFGPSPVAPPPRFLIATDAFRIPVPEIGGALLPIAQSIGTCREIALYEEGIDQWLDTFRPLQLYDLWSTLGGWATRPNRTLSQAVRERIELSSAVKTDDVAGAIVRREALTRRLVNLLGDDGILVLPTAHDLPPKREAPLAALVEFRERTLALTCVASLARLPQISLPVASVDGCPVGLSIMAGPGQDGRLLVVADELSAAFERQGGR
jgi:amidase